MEGMENPMGYVSESGKGANVEHSLEETRQTARRNKRKSTKREVSKNDKQVAKSTRLEPVQEETLNGVPADTLHKDANSMNPAMENKEKLVAEDNIEKLQGVPEVEKTHIWSESKLSASLAEEPGPIKVVDDCVSQLEKDAISEELGQIADQLQAINSKVSKIQDVQALCDIQYTLRNIEGSIDAILQGLPYCSTNLSRLAKKLSMQDGSSTLRPDDPSSSLPTDDNQLAIPGEQDLAKLYTVNKARRTTVHEVWSEWDVGDDEKPPIKLMEKERIDKRIRWCSENDLKFWNKQMRIIRLIEKMIPHFENNLNLVMERMQEIVDEVYKKNLSSFREALAKPKDGGVNIEAASFNRRKLLDTFLKDFV